METRHAHFLIAKPCRCEFIRTQVSKYTFVVRINSRLHCSYTPTIIIFFFASTVQFFILEKS